MAGSVNTLGAHMSVAGGLPRAVERAVIHRCDAFQIFAKNAKRIWRSKRTLPFRARSLPPTAGRVVAISQVGGLHHRYERRAA